MIANTCNSYSYLNLHSKFFNRHVGRHCIDKIHCSLYRPFISLILDFGKSKSPKSCLIPYLFKVTTGTCHYSWIVKFKSIDSIPKFTIKNQAGIYVIGTMISRFDKRWQNIDLISKFVKIGKNVPYQKVKASKQDKWTNLIWSMYYYVTLVV